MRISDWISDVCSSDLNANLLKAPGYGLVNLNLHYDAPSSTRGRSAISFYFAVQNLFDQTYVGSASNISDRLGATAETLAASGGVIYAGNPRLYYGGVREIGRAHV